MVGTMFRDEVGDAWRRRRHGGGYRAPGVNGRATRAGGIWHQQAAVRDGETGLRPVRGRPEQEPARVDLTPPRRPPSHTHTHTHTDVCTLLLIIAAKMEATCLCRSMLSSPVPSPSCRPPEVVTSHSCRPVERRAVAVAAAAPFMVERVRVGVR